MRDNVPVSTCSSSVKDSVNEPKRSKRPKIETSFGPNFLTNFLNEDFDVNFLSDEPVFAFFIERSENL